MIGNNCGPAFVSRRTGIRGIALGVSEPVRLRGSICPFANCPAPLFEIGAFVLPLLTDGRAGLCFDAFTGEAVADGPALAMRDLRI